MNQYATTKTRWVYTQAGYEHSLTKDLHPDELDKHKPGMPVSPYYQQRCLMSWLENGWVEEADGQITLF